jgi:predicted dehydrogenase
MLDRVGPDGVIVCTPTELHLDPTLAALDAGAHVLVEKPIAATAAEARQIVAKAAETGRQVLVGHHRRYYPLLARAREIVEGGGLGRLITVHGHWTLKKDDAYYASDWRKRRAAGPVLTNLIHEIDTLRFICGEIRSISAEVTNAVRGFEKEDAAALAMTFESGAIGTFMLSDGTPSPWAWELATGENPAFAASRCNTHRLTGTAAALDFPGLVLWTPTSQSEGWRKPIQSRPVEYAAADAYERQCAHFCAVIRGDEAPVITAEDGARTLAATLAVFDAAESGRRVML